MDIYGYGIIVVLADEDTPVDICALGDEIGKGNHILVSFMINGSIISVDQ